MAGMVLVQSTEYNLRTVMRREYYIVAAVVALRAVRRVTARAGPARLVAGPAETAV
jgi:hypothetical protein